MRILDKALRFLNDGKWHTLEEIGRELKLNHRKSLKLFSFLVNYNFCISTDYSLKVREDFVTFFAKLEEIEG